MGAPHRSKRRGLRLWCFARPFAGSEIPERWSKSPVKGPAAAVGPRNGGKDGQVSALVPTRDSQDDLTAYLGKAHRCASSSSILAQAASLADSERRLKGLPEGEAVLGGPPLARTPPSSLPPSTPENNNSVHGSACGDFYRHSNAQSPEEVAGVRAPPVSPFADYSLRSKASSQAVGTPGAEEYLKRAGLESSGSSAIVDGNGAATATTPAQVKSKAVPGEPHAALLLGPRTSHSEASEVASQCSHSLLSDDSGGSDGRAPPGGAARSFSLPRLVLSDLTQQLSGGGVSEAGQLSRVQSRTLILGSLSLSQHLEDDGTDHGGVSPSASTAGSHRSAVQRRHTLSAMVLLTAAASDSDSDDEAESEESGGHKMTSKGPTRALSLPHTLRRAPSARSLQRRLSNVFEGHHVPLQKLRRQMGDPKEPPGDLLSLMARRVFSQQDVLSRMDSEGLVSHLDARSSLLTPQPTADGPLPALAAVAPVPKLPPIRTRPLADSAKHD